MSLGYVFLYFVIVGRIEVRLCRDSGTKGSLKTGLKLAVPMRKLLRQDDVDTI